MVLLKCPAVRALQPIELVDEGMVKRVRGIAHSMLVSPQTSSRLVDGARGWGSPARGWEGGLRSMSTACSVAQSVLTDAQHIHSDTRAQPNLVTWAG